jgi:DNA-binding MarR family transcriptional regulator
MNNEIQVLKGIQNNNINTQRGLSKITGISLGNVNFLLKRLIKKGFIDIEKVNSRTIKYIITPQGIRASSEATYRYLVETFSYINEIALQLDGIIDNISDKEFDIVLLGSSDVISEWIQIKLRSMNIKYHTLNTFEEIKEVSFNKNSLFLVWNPEYLERVNGTELRYINILENL